MASFQNNDGGDRVLVCNVNTRGGQGLIVEVSASTADSNTLGFPFRFAAEGESVGDIGCAVDNTDTAVDDTIDDGAVTFR
jgi:hypothetical protein